MWRCKFLALAIALEVLVAASVFATGHSEQSSSAAEPMTLTFWNGFTAADGEALRGIVKRWNAEKPGITIEMSTLVWATFYDKLTASIAAGRGPDLVAFHYERVPEYASRGQLLPLDDYMRVLGLKSSDFVEIPWGGGIYKGKRYSVPLDWMPQIGLYYNKDHYKEVGLDPEKPPTTLDTFVDYNKKLKTNSRWGYMVSRGPSLARLYLSMVYQHGGDLLNEDQSKSMVNTPAGLASAKILHDFIYLYQIAPKDTAMNEEITAFKAGTVTHMLNHLAYSNDFLGQSELHFGYAQIPLFGTKQAVLANSHQLSIPMPQKVDKKRIEATLSFVHWLLVDRGIDWAAAGQLPVRKDLLAAAEFRQRFPIHQAQVAMAPNLHFPAKTTKWGEVYSRLDPNLQGLLLGQVTPEQAVAAMAREIDEILAK